MAKNFYFSYTYDLSNNLQVNLNKHKFLKKGKKEINGLFIWNNYILKNAFGKGCLNSDSNWVLPIIHGFVDQAGYLSLKYRDLRSW